MGETLLLCGPVGAGKTTYASARVAEGFERISYDAATWARGHHGIDPPAALLAEVDAEQRSRLSSLVHDGRDVVIDISASTREIRDDFRRLVSDAGGSAQLIVFTAPIDVLRARVRARAANPGPDSLVLDDERLVAYVDGFEWPTDDEHPTWLATG